MLNRDLAQLRVWYVAGQIKEAVGVPGKAAAQKNASLPFDSVSAGIYAAPDGKGVSN